MYHCTKLGRCLPVYDHYCPFLKVTVYLRTIKAYLYLLILLPLDVVLSFVVSAVALARYQTLVIHLTITVILSGFMIVPMVIFWTHDKFWLLACKNCTFPEKDVSL